MPTDTGLEQRIRDALDYQAGQAPHPAAIRLPAGRTRRRPALPLVLAAAALVALAGVGVPVGLRLIGGPAAQHTAQPAVSTSSPSTSAAAQPGVVLRYRPGWLPGGYAEAQRGIETLNGFQVRVWTPGRGTTIASGPSIELAVNPITASDRADITGMVNSERKQSVNGAQGAYTWVPPQSGLSGARLIWLPDPDTALIVTVYQAGDASDTALRVARSVVPDGAATIQNPITVRDTTGFQDPEYFTNGTAPTHWSAQLIMAGTGSSSLTVSWGAPDLAPTAKPLPDTHTIQRELDGQTLTVTLVGGGQDELARIADAVTVTPGSDPSWLGD